MTRRSEEILEEGLAFSVGRVSNRLKVVLHWSVQSVVCSTRTCFASANNRAAPRFALVREAGAREQQ